MRKILLHWTIVVLLIVSHARVNAGPSTRPAIGLTIFMRGMNVKPDEDFVIIVEIENRSGADIVIIDDPILAKVGEQPVAVDGLNQFGVFPGMSVVIESDAPVRSFQLNAVGAKVGTPALILSKPYSFSFVRAVINRNAFQGGDVHFCARLRGFGGIWAESEMFTARVEK